MNKPKKFFEDNKKHINSEVDPVMWNLNNGLLALAEQLEKQEKMLTSMRHFMNTLPR